MDETKIIVTLDKILRLQQLLQRELKGQYQEGYSIDVQNMISATGTHIEWYSSTEVMRVPSGWDASDC